LPVSCELFQSGTVGSEGGVNHDTFDKEAIAEGGLNSS
jgi:hypothetical protein